MHGGSLPCRPCERRHVQPRRADDGSTAEAAGANLAASFATESYNHAREHNIYFAKSTSLLPEDHPALMRFNTSNDTLCADQIRHADGPALPLGPLCGLSCRHNGQAGRVCHGRSPAALMLTSYRDRVRGISDRSEFTTTLLLQAPEHRAANSFTAPIYALPRTRITKALRACCVAMTRRCAA